MSEKTKRASRSRVKKADTEIKSSVTPESALQELAADGAPEFANATFQTEFPDPVFSDTEAPSAQPIALRHKVLVWFNFVRPDMSSGSARITVHDMVDIRFEAQLLNVEAEIAGQLGLSKVEITNWRSLDG